MTVASKKARYIMVGGFLGAGKSTSILQLAYYLKLQGLTAGLITNDQGERLVDTAFFHSRGLRVEEIAGGCFCCRFSSLMEAAERLSIEERPDVFVAEPVGSCTDLVASVSYPLRRLYGDDYTIAPLSVLVDPVRALRVLGLEPGRNFSSRVTYVYRKQLEEADLIVVNKSDIVEAERLERLRGALQAEFAQASIFVVSARQATGLESWFERMTQSEQRSTQAMHLDYDAYAEGEAALGWLNCTVELDSQRDFNGNRLLSELIRDLGEELDAAEIAHLKMTLASLHGSGEIATINLVRNDYIPELSQSLTEPLARGELIVNLRAEGSPDELQAALKKALEQCARNFSGLSARVSHLEHFRPARPVPTYRLATPGGAV